MEKDSYSFAETVKRRDETIKRMLNTPHKPHKPNKSKSKRKPTHKNK